VTSDLTLSWDVLDFGLSYVRAKQKADATLIANERKRKVANRIIENVRTAYWRAVSAERLMGKLASLEGDIQEALTAADEAYRQKKTPPLAALTYQRELLNIQNETQTMHNELVVAKRQLAALMNVNPATPFTLVLPSRDIEAPNVKVNPDEMVRFGGFDYSSNDYLYNNNWTNWGAAASWNIFELFRYPAHKRSNEVEKTLLEKRALALTMAVITQVHVSASKYEISKRRYKVRKVSYQNFVREKMNSIVAEARYDIARAELQNSFASIYSSIGVDTYGNIDAEEASVKDLAKHLQRHWVRLENALKK